MTGKLCSISVCGGSSAAVTAGIKEAKVIGCLLVVGPNGLSTRGPPAGRRGVGDGVAVAGLLAVRLLPTPVASPDDEFSAVDMGADTGVRLGRRPNRADRSA